MKQSPRFILGAFAAGALVAGALSGCSALAQSSPTPSQTPAVTPLIENRINDAHICGQVSTLTTMLIYANYDFEHGIIDTAARDDRYRAVAEGWLNILTTTDLSVTSSVWAAQVQIRSLASARGDDFIPTLQELQTITVDVGQACVDGGSLIAAKGAPGQG